ncbi:hypothetical protein [Clostridium sp. AF32-12BH]|uniref:hypothetical protein n=1 Tax=Clostridium sp. AF32-12BH TaxID=2292006 RepID=UPI0015FAD39A|nr:hypothetical protein [Clostridium sp. AF32-12BH]
MEDWFFWGLAFFVSSVLPGIAARHLKEMRTRHEMEALEREWQKIKEGKENEK